MKITAIQADAIAFAIWSMDCDSSHALKNGDEEAAKEIKGHGHVLQGLLEQINSDAFRREYPTCEEEAFRNTNPNPTREDNPHS